MGRRRKGCIEGFVDGCFGVVEGLAHVTGGVIEGTVGLIGACMPYGEENDTHVERGSDFWGHKYKKTRGICYRCHGTGTVRGRTCRKCGGSGKYSRTTWYE
jgi:RecJ-like exonuclease